MSEQTSTADLMNSSERLPPIDEIYNNAISAYAISAAWELGLLDQLQGRVGALDLDGFARERDLDVPSVRAISRALALANVLELDDDGTTAAAGPLFADVMLKKGFFYWLTRGCGELFANMPQLVDNRSRTGDFVKRDYKAIGIAAREAGLSFVDPPFYELVASRGLKHGVDLGCGSGERLIRLAQQDPQFRGIGMDIADGAVALAKDAIAAAALGDRVTIIRDDAKRPAYQPEFEKVDFISTFMMGHDLWPRAACLESLKLIGQAFPAATDLIVCDTYRSDLASTARPPVFTLGFETAHAVMGQELPSLKEWVEVFEESGWRMINLIEFDLPPYTALMHLTREPALHQIF